jgi:protein gp37
VKDTKIAWTHHTFNPWWGCVKVSDGCKNCYAEGFAKRTGHDIWGIDKPRRFFGPTHWAEPYKWNAAAEKSGERRRVFCASMADWAETHADSDTQAKMNGYRAQLAKVIKETPELDWLMLTKRIEDSKMYLDWMFLNAIPDNLWLGTTAENQAQANQRIAHLLTTPASRHFVSIEPQLEQISIEKVNHSLWQKTLSAGIDWVIVGGESGPRFRAFNVEWARSLRDECQEAGIAFFMKQLGGHPHKHDKLEDLPEDLQIREFPA